MAEITIQINPMPMTFTRREKPGIPRVKGAIRAAGLRRRVLGRWEIRRVNNPPAAALHAVASAAYVSARSPLLAMFELANSFVAMVPKPRRFKPSRHGAAA